jgi:hypothetical protein
MALEDGAQAGKKQIKIKTEINFLTMEGPPWPIFMAV